MKAKNLILMFNNQVDLSVFVEKYRAINQELFDEKEEL